MQFVYVCTIKLILPTCSFFFSLFKDDVRKACVNQCVNVLIGNEQKKLLKLQKNVHRILMVFCSIKTDSNKSTLELNFKFSNCILT